MALGFLFTFLKTEIVCLHFWKLRLLVYIFQNLIAAGMEAHWPKGRGIFHNTEKTFLMWVNEEDHLRIISMEKGTVEPPLYHTFGRRRYNRGF